MTLRKIFPNVRALRSHACHWADLPTMESAVHAGYAAHDGDMQELHELADRIFDAATETGRNPVPLVEGLIEHAALTEASKRHSHLGQAGIFWQDRVAALLADWPARIVEKEAGE